MATRKTKTKVAEKKNPWRSTHVPLPEWIMFWALVLCTMALTIVNFTKAFEPIPVDGMDDQTAAQFSAIRASLEQQIATLQAQVSNTPAPTNTCEAVSNPGPADSHVLYVDPKTHVSMSLPYSTSWGIGCAPLQTMADEIHFGPLDGAGHFDAAIEILEPGGGIATSTERFIVSGLTVYKTHDNNSTVWHAIGRTHSYNIYSVGWLTDAEVTKIIQSLKVVK